MGKRPPTMIDNLLRYWPIYGIGATLCGTLVLWASVPGRLARAEEQIDDLKGWARELQGYTRANQQMLQQAAPRPTPPLPRGASRPSASPELERICYDEHTWLPKACP